MGVKRQWRWLFGCLAIQFAGCRYMPDPDPSVWQYVSRGDHAIVVSMPDYEASKKIGSDLYYPVKFGKWDGRRYRQTNVFWCKMTDSGSSGNYRVETSDGSFILDDSNFCNCGDPEAVYTSVTMKRDGKEVMIPLEWNFELDEAE